MTPLQKRLIGVHVEATSFNKEPPTPGRLPSFLFGLFVGLAAAAWLVWSLK